MSDQQRESYEYLIKAVFGSADLPGLGEVSFSKLKSETDAVMATLSDREAGVISLRFGLQDGISKTLNEVGEHYALTNERIQQIESRTMSKLRHPDRSQLLRKLFEAKSE